MSLFYLTSLLHLNCKSVPQKNDKRLLLDDRKRHLPLIAFGAS